MNRFIFSSGLNKLNSEPVEAGSQPRNDQLGNRSLSVRIFFFSLLVFIFLGTLGAGSMKLGSDEIQLVGRVYVMGNEPLTVVALKLDDGEVYALLGEHDKELRGLQGRRLSVVGKSSVEKPRGAKAIIVKSFKVLEQQ